MHPHLQNQKPAAPYQHQEYPKALYHPDGRTKNVDSPEAEEALLAEGWAETSFPEKPPVPAQNLDDPQCPKCLNMRAKFEEAWKGLTGELAKANAALFDLQKAHGAQTQELADVKQAHGQVQDDNRELLAQLKAQPDDKKTKK